jgi:hypothetical protein
LPLVSMVPPWLINVIGSALTILAPPICKVPPVNTGPGEPLGPDASVQAIHTEPCPSCPDHPKTKHRDG